MDNITALTLGILGSMIAALIMGPILTTPWSYYFIVFVSKFLGWTKTAALSGNRWEIEWHVQSQHFPPVNTSPLQLSAVLNIAAAEWSATSNEGHKYTYRFVGQLRSGKFTAYWFDTARDDVGYIGALQMIFSPASKDAEGQWLGFSKDSSVKADAIFLRRK